MAEIGVVRTWVRFPHAPQFFFKMDKKRRLDAFRARQNQADARPDFRLVRLEPVGDFFQKEVEMEAVVFQFGPRPQAVSMGRLQPISRFSGREKGELRRSDFRFGEDEIEVVLL